MLELHTIGTELLVTGSPYAFSDSYRGKTCFVVSGQRIEGNKAQYVVQLDGKMLSKVHSDCLVLPKKSDVDIALDLVKQGLQGAEIRYKKYPSDCNHISIAIKELAKAISYDVQHYIVVPPGLTEIEKVEDEMRKLADRLSKLKES